MLLSINDTTLKIVIRNTRYLGSFSPRRLIFSMIILSFKWVDVSQQRRHFANICSVWQHIYLCLYKESSMFGNLSRIFCRVVNSLLINMEILVSKWLVVNWIYNRSFVVTQVRLRLFHRPHGKDVGTFQIFISTLQYFYFLSIVLHDFLPALEDNNL